MNREELQKRTDMYNEAADKLFGIFPDLAPLVTEYQLIPYAFSPTGNITLEEAIEKANSLESWFHEGITDFFGYTLTYRIPVGDNVNQALKVRIFQRVVAARDWPEFRAQLAGPAMQKMEEKFSAIQIASLAVHVLQANEKFGSTT